MVNIINYNNDRYVNSRELNQVLGLSIGNYTRDLKAWLEKEYLFLGKVEMTYPVKNYDYIEYSSPTKSIDNQSFNRIGNFATEYLIRLELVKLITLDSTSKVKKQFVQWLLSLEEKVESFQLISRDMILGLLELSKLCMYIDNQLKFYDEHKKYHLQFAETSDDYKEFDRWRNAILKIDYFKEIANQYHISSIMGNLKTKIEQRAFLDDIGSIRDSMFDFLKMHMYNIDPLFPKSTEKALDLANFVRKMFEVAGLKPDIKPRHYNPDEQIDLFRDAELENINYMLINKSLKMLNT